jgi:hypothetical protein
VAAWKWFVLAVLYFFVFLGKSGGGLGPSTMCGEMRTLFVLGTVASFLAAGALFLVAVLATVGRIGRSIVPRTTDVPSSFNLDVPESRTTAVVAPATPRRRLTPFLLALLGFAGVILTPSGCTAFNVCANAERPVAAEGTNPLLRFSGELPQKAEKGTRDDGLTAYTAVFDATAPWQVAWGTSGDRVRLDVFTSDAVQSGNYFPEAGHVKVVLAGREGSERVSQSGRFCVRIELRDEQFENAQSAYYGPDLRQRTGPPPTPRPMSWTVTIGPP